MTSIGNVYGEALYSLAREEGISQQILGEIAALEQSFAQEPAFLPVQFHTILMLTVFHL